MMVCPSSGLTGSIQPALTRTRRPQPTLTRTRRPQPAPTRTRRPVMTLVIMSRCCQQVQPVLCTSHHKVTRLMHWACNQSWIYHCVNILYIQFQWLLRTRTSCYGVGISQEILTLNCINITIASCRSFPAVFASIQTRELREQRTLLKQQNIFTSVTVGKD